MKTKPLLNYKAPNYPRIEVVFAEPDILIKNMPESWKANKMIVTAVISFSLAACRGQSQQPNTDVKTEQVAEAKTNVPGIIMGKMDSSRVAPIFVHGDGVGASGCVMIAPPVYLSEEDALNIILGELKKEGLDFNDKFQGDSIKVIHKKVVYNDDPKITDYNDRITYVSETEKLYPDAYNKNLNMVIEFVSFDDYSKYGDEEPDWSSVSSYYIKSAAEKIRKAFIENGEYGTVVFYDPVGWADREERGNWDQMEKDGRKKAVEMLKQQVADFIDWLKKEKILQEK
jgi:hypothetical protein